jgi:hypothetical protein
MLVLLAVTAVAVGFFGVQKKSQSPSPQPVEEWFTMGLWEYTSALAEVDKDLYDAHDGKFTIRYLLRVSNRGKRDVGIAYSPQSEARALSTYSKQIKPYVLVLQPWIQKVMSLDEVKKAIPGLELVPCASLNAIENAETTVALP